MPFMTKKKPRRNPPAYKNPRVVFHCPADMLAAIEQHAKDNGRTRTSELIILLRQACRQAGLWPPPGQSPAP